MSLDFTRNIIYNTIIIIIYYGIVKLNCLLESRIIAKKYIRVEHYMTWLSLSNVFPLRRNSELTLLYLVTITLQNVVIKIRALFD